MGIKWIRKKVLHGDKGGRKIGFPTVNLSTSNFGKDIKQGVYACFVRFENNIYKGSLFYGPRLVKNEPQNVLEIFIHNFSRCIYGKYIEFTIIQFIREVKHFKTMDDLKIQLKDDILETEEILSLKENTN